MKYYLFDFSMRCIIVWAMLYVSYIFWPSDSIWIGYLVATLLSFLLSFTTYKDWKD